MKVKELIDRNAEETSKKFSLFERCFSYPLGERKRFRIDHGNDYNAFYRAIGTARTYYLEDDDRVIGAIGAAIQAVILPNGEEVRLAYVGDLKVIPEFQKSRATIYLLKAIRPFLEVNADIAYGVVMDGTNVTPSNYTGRGGIPSFYPTEKRYILRFSSDVDRSPVNAQKIDEGTGKMLLTDLQAGLHLITLADYKVRAEMRAFWISSNDSAVGMLEDTRKAKRLYLDDGEEMLSSHLSYFYFRKADAGKDVLLCAIQESKHQNYPAMFVALNEEQYKLLAPELSNLRYEVATATVYCTGALPENFPINTSEI